MDRLSIELPQDIVNQDDFLRRNTWFEARDTSSVYMITIRDYRLRTSIAPFDYVKNDIKSIILNNRRFEFLQTLENGIFNQAIKENTFKLL
jgi:predicted Zn-dependent protease